MLVTQTKNIGKLTKTPRVKLMGCPIDTLSLNETINRVHEVIQKKIIVQHVVVNAGKFVLMEKEPELKKIIYDCAIVNADGQSVVWALKWMGRPIPERVTGIDLMERLFVEADKKQYRVYFLGASQSVLNKVLQIVEKNYPNLVIAGSRNGYFHDEENDEVVQDVAAAKADILFVAMGSPKKEYWLSKNIEKMKTPFCMGVGGSFDVLSGRAKRAPQWVQNVGMEWFFRFAQEPRRLWRRYLLGNFTFISLLASSYFEHRIQLRRQSKENLKKQEIT